MNRVSKTRRITANLPIHLLAEATNVTHTGVTETIIQGPKLLKKSSAYDKVQALKGRLKLEINIEESLRTHGASRLVV